VLTTLASLPTAAEFSVMILASCFDVALGRPSSNEPTQKKLCAI